jgi:transposase
MNGKSTSKGKSAGRRVPRASGLGQGQNGEAKRRAAIVLEVLAGMRTPREAAAALGLSVSCYYLLERKALQGLLDACQPQPKGAPVPGPERQLARLQKALDKSRQECLRQASLVRATQRAMGLPAVAKPAGPSKANSAKEGRKTRRRRPTIRAMRAAKTLRENSSLGETPTEVKQSLDVPCDSTCVATDQKERGDGAQGPQAARSGTC